MSKEAKFISVYYHKDRRPTNAGWAWTIVFSDGSDERGHCSSLPKVPTEQQIKDAIIEVGKVRGITVNPSAVKTTDHMGNPARAEYSIE
jgi:hypothetical protein